MTHIRPALSRVSTRRLIVALSSTLVITFVLETLSHGLTARVLPRSPWALALADAMLLAILALPALYFAVINPLARHAAERALLDRTQAENAAARLVAILEATPDLVSIADLEGRLDYMNRAGRAMVGIGEFDDLAGHDLWSSSADKARVALTEGIRTAMREGVWYGETEFKALDGPAISVSLVMVAHAASNGTVAFISTIARDITASKQAAAELQRSEAAFRTLVQAAPDGIFIADAHGRYRDVNALGCRLLGYTREELLQLSVADVVSTEEVARVAPELAILKHGEVIRQEWRFRRKDGTLFSGEVSATVLPEGRLLGIVRDITERKQAETTLRLQVAALQAAADAIVITSNAGIIEWVNPSFTRLTGYTPEEALGRNPRDLVKSGKQTAEFYARLWETILAGETWQGEMINRRKDGSLYTEYQSVTPILDGGGAVTHFVAIKQDITERLQLEAQFRQAQKLESVGRLSAGIAHDFNNLLTVINGMSSLVLDQIPQDASARTDIQEILHAGERAAKLTRQLLAFSRQQVLAPRVLNLNTVIDGLERLLPRLIGEDVELRLALASDVRLVSADPGQIEQVLVNLAVNARDAMPSGGRLTIETRNIEVHPPHSVRQGVMVRPGSYVELVVSDSGHGMDDATLARVFEPFFTTKGPGVGTGLGLATVYGIIKQSRGYIFVKTALGRGTHFEMLLPSVAGAELPEAAVLPAAGPRGSETVLIVDDDAAIRTVAARFLGPAGYTVLQADNGHDALRLVAGHDGPVHVLITDVVMPGLDGRQLAEELVRNHPGMKVLFMSGYTPDVVLRHGVEQARVSFLSKPFTVASIREKVRVALGSSA